MSEINKTYRIRTDVGDKVNNGFISINTDIIQDYEALDILSVKLNSSEMYRLHNSNYGVVVGRVLANNGFGVPNAKLSIFIKSDGDDGEKVKSIYPFVSTNGVNDDGVRYNLLPDDKVNDCHQVVGTFPNKRFMLDNDVVLEVYDKYYKYTTRTNNSGDYLIMGVPVGTHTLHMDLDLSDCGILSQKPRDFVYKGYTVEQFENPTTFKGGTNYSELSQIFTQDQIITVRPFWGNESLGEPIGITRADINIAFKFEPTCVFIGCIVSDNASNGITQKCMGTENMGNMEELTTGSGTIEMIRKTPSGEIESFQIRGTQLINGDGVWCYQIPMNLDYMMTDEYGNMVPTDDPNKGIPTRASVRFRMSMQDNEENLDFYYRAKVLVPHNPQVLRDGTVEEYDYEFGTYTKDESFRDLFWDNVYTVKSYIPRFQKKKVRGWKDKRFTGIKNCNFFGNNNPIPYNNIRIRLPLMFTIMCAILKCLIFLISLFNSVVNFVGYFLAKLGGLKIWKWRPFGSAWDAAKGMKLSILNEGLCPDLENWYFAPILGRKIKRHKQYNLLQQTLDHISKEDGNFDETSLDFNNQESEDEVMCLTTKTDYLISCMEMNLAMEYRVINFDFYNDWINGLIYVPRFRRYIRPKKKFLGFTIARAKVRGCMDDTKIYGKSRRYTQLCSISYIPEVVNNKHVYINADNPLRSSSSKRAIKKANKYHKKPGISQFKIFGRRGGICHEHTTSKKQHVYYMKPCELVEKNTYTGKVTLFATDIVLLGSLKSCDENGLPQAFKYLSSTSYVMPTNLALTNMETNGYLYTNENNTVCTGKSNQTINDDTEKDNGITRANPDDGLAAELMMYKNSGDENLDTQYDGNELSDIIPLTEAAGISWNYTGPGQGSANEGVMYQPGGHFLGISCINSQTNVKSCINLSRICEVGVNMSERKEDIGYLKGDNAEEEHPVYIYSAPTGFISGTDIIGGDFRAMFATLNHKRLQATKLNPETGYYYYDFDFVKPLNFNGEFKYMVNKGYSYYNNKSGELVQDWGSNENKNIFKLLGININTDERPDFDKDESLHTQTKTYEATSIDYYRFRFGLNDDDLINKRNSIHDSHFLYATGNKKVLPQYENSFYFYFGMKAGASAIDEFNKQFFATCETSVLAQLPPSINAKVEELDLCQGTGVVKIILDNIETPTVLFSCTIDKGDGIEKVKLVDRGVDEKSDKLLDNNKFVHEFELEFGNYHFDVMDANGELLSTDISVGVNLFNYDIVVSEYNINYATDLIKNGSRDEGTKNLFYGGCVEISNLICDENYIDFINSEVTLSIDGINMINDECSGSIIFDDYIDDSNLEKGSVILYVNSANTRYNLYLTYKCSLENNPVEHKVFLQTFEVRDGSSVELRMGYSDVPFYLTVESSSAHTPNTLILPLSGFNDVNENFSRVSAKTNCDIYFGSNNLSNETFDSDVDSDNKPILHNWLKRISTIKSTTSGIPFSNNIHTSSGYKVVWGIPQNEWGVMTGGEIFSTEDPIEKYSNYSLDDDSTYLGGTYYSAIGIDENIVSGDFFAYLSGGTISMSKLSNPPIDGTGYVFKSLPDGNLSFHVYNSGGTKSLEPQSGCGLYYSSFKYPVETKEFKVDVNFYIWENLSLVRDENSDAEPEISFTEMAGKTEAKIENGIRFNNVLGSSNVSGDFNEFSGFNISNVHIENKDNRPSGTTINLSGMMVTTVMQDENNETKKVVLSATSIDKNNNRYAIGVSGISDVFYNISEGYPVVEDSGFDFSQLVINTSNSFNYKDYFADYITYDFLKGLGFSVVPKSDNGIGSFKYEKNMYTSDVGFICAQKKTSEGLLYLPKGNDKYVYIRLGGKKRPTYYVLCKYIASGSKDKKDKKFENKEGELCIIKIDYYKNRRCRIYWSYVSEDDSDNEVSNIKQCSQRLKRVGGIRNNLDRLLGYGENKEGWLNNRLYLYYCEPHLNYRINADVIWKNEIELGKTNFEKLYTKNKNEIDNNHIYYYVDKFSPKQSGGNDSMTLYKIYTNFIYKQDETDMVLSYYGIEADFNGKINSEVDEITFSGVTIVNNKAEAKGFTYNNAIQSPNTKYFKVSYIIDGNVDNDDKVPYSAISSYELVIEFSDNIGKYYILSGGGFTAKNDVFTFSISGTPNITGFDDTDKPVSYGIPYVSGGNNTHVTASGATLATDDDKNKKKLLNGNIRSIEKSYLFNIEMNSGDQDKSVDKKEMFINFYLDEGGGNIGDAVTFYITRDRKYDYSPILGYKNGTEFINYPKVNETDLINKYEELELYANDYCLEVSGDKYIIFNSETLLYEYEDNSQLPTIMIREITSKNYNGDIRTYGDTHKIEDVDAGKKLSARHALTVSQSNLPSYAVYEFFADYNYDKMGKEAISRLVAFRNGVGGTKDLSFNVSEITIPYFYDYDGIISSNKTYGVYLFSDNISQEDLAGMDITYKWDKNDDVIWPLSYQILDNNNNSVIFLVEDSDSEWKYFKDKSMLSGNTLIATFKSGDTEYSAEVKVIRKPIVDVELTFNEDIINYDESIIIKQNQITLYDSKYFSSFIPYLKTSDAIFAIECSRDNVDLYKGSLELTNGGNYSIKVLGKAQISAITPLDINIFKNYREWVLQPVVDMGKCNILFRRDDISDNSVSFYSNFNGKYDYYYANSNYYIDFTSDSSYSYFGLSVNYYVNTNDDSNWPTTSYPRSCKVTIKQSSLGNGVTLFEEDNIRVQYAEEAGRNQIYESDEIFIPYLVFSEEKDVTINVNFNMY